MARNILVWLLSFSAGFVDTAGFLGLQGLFTAHVTGNFVTLGAALVFGTQGIIAKLIALPEFLAVIVLVRLIGTGLTTRRIVTSRLVLAAEVAFLLAFFLLAVRFGPFPDSDSPMALVTGFTGVAAMAIQNAIQRIHYSGFPPTTIMTGNTTQAALDAVDLINGATRKQSAAIRARLASILSNIFYFAVGCAAAAGLYLWIGFWSLAVPVVAVAIAIVLHKEK
ncbi:MAG TPA: YoaK family protein [Pseudolabrys sp.]|nr:YoaK family protein [Pseudolabrys sp.]